MEKSKAGSLIQKLVNMKDNHPPGFWGSLRESEGIKNCLYNVHYIATTPSRDKQIEIGTPIFIQRERIKRHFSDEQPTTSYTLFGIMRVGDNNYTHQRNDVRFFSGEDGHTRVHEALEGVEVILDKRYARERIDVLRKEIEDLEEAYELIPSEMLPEEEESKNEKK